MNVNINQVFPINDYPKYTYVERINEENNENNDTNENALEDTISDGRVCYIYGVSKVGKTSLLKRVAEKMELIIAKISCSQDMTPESIWKLALAELGNKDFIRNDPSFVISCLKHSKRILVIEELHYLKKDVKDILAQHIKLFADESIPLIIIETSDSNMTVNESNSDLIGRINPIEITTWNSQELQKIVRLGFRYLEVLGIPDSYCEFISEESLGFPYITQKICNKLCRHKKINKKGMNIKPTNDDLIKAFVSTAKDDFRQFHWFYNEIKEITVEWFIVEMLRDDKKLVYSYNEICQKLKMLNLNFSHKEIKDALRKINKIQQSKGKVIEWNNQQGKLLIIEPFFLFCLKWMEEEPARQRIKYALDTIKLSRSV